MDSMALTKIQSITLIAIIVVAAVAGGVAYVLWSGQAEPTGDIIVGVCTDLGTPYGKETWQGAVLGAEQINAEGGILGRNLTVVVEDDDSSSGDIAAGINALTKLITVDNADYVIGVGVSPLIYQDACSEHKKILFNIGSGIDEYSQRVLDDYDKYKYSFRIWPLNATILSQRHVEDVITVSNYTGFTKVALLQQDAGAFSKQIETRFASSLPEHGLELVYSAFVPFTTTDFTSYFAAVEASGAEILFPCMYSLGVQFVKEWHDRQSPFVLWGGVFDAVWTDFWNLTEGKCDTVSFIGSPVAAGYPLTNKTVPTQEAYIQRWGEIPTDAAVGAYDTVRFILSDAIKRAGTTETEAVIRALEETAVETSTARRFVFSSSHDVMQGPGVVDDLNAGYQVEFLFQWQNGARVPVYPRAIFEEIEATYKFPPWQGPWRK